MIGVDMRSIEELRPIIKGLYPDGLWIGHVQPLTRVCCWFWDTESQLRKHGRIGWCPPTPDTEQWPIPKEAVGAGITPEEWASYAKKAWGEWFSGGPDGTVKTAIGTITPEQHQEIGKSIAETANKIATLYMAAQDKTPGEPVRFSDVKRVFPKLR
jgi:hypothetical protein